MRSFLYDPHILLDHTFPHLSILGLLESLEDSLGLLVHFDDQLLVLLFFKGVKLPLAVIAVDPPQLLEVMLDLIVDAVEVGLHQLVLELLLVGSVLTVLVQHIERLLAN